MSKSTKIITSVVAIALVIAAMVVGIYAATTGGATISANVSWQATAGIELTLSGQADNGSAQKTVGAYVINTTTTNEDAENIVTAGDNLNLDFIDQTAPGTDEDDGVNTAEPIEYTYTIVNTSETVPLVVKLLQAPTTNADKNVTVMNSTAKIASNTGTDVYAALIGADGVTVPVEDTLTIVIKIDVTNDNAAVDNYNAGVVFSFAK